MIGQLRARNKRPKRVGKKEIKRDIIVIVIVIVIVMEDKESSKLWRFNKEDKKEIKSTTDNNKKLLTVKEAFSLLYKSVEPNDSRELIPLAHGDPSPYQCFRTSQAAEDAVVSALRSATFNGYPTNFFGLLSAKKAIAKYISKDLRYNISANDVNVTCGCKHAIQVAISSLATPESNILLPHPTYPTYDAVAKYYGLEVRHYDLIPENGWEIDINSVESLADSNTVAIVVINPGNPTGSVHTRQHLKKVAETARKLGLLVIADEVYEHISFGGNPFVRMAVYGSIVPVLTLGSLSKRWVVPGWRLGWLVATDPNDILQTSVFMERVKTFLILSSEPPTFLQAAVTQIIEKTEDDFFSRCMDVLRQDVDIIFENLKEIPCITCPTKPQGSMFIMVKLNVSMLKGIQDDADFCLKLAKQEKVIVLPGSTLGLENWLRITFAVEPSILEEGLVRMKNFCQRHTMELQT